MQLKLIVILTSFFSFLPFVGQAGYEFAAGPEVYHIERTREGGTWQSGVLAGVRATFNRIEPFRVYLGADILAAEGTIKGKTASKRTLHSTLTDLIYEGRFGYTFCVPGRKKQFFTPYLGYGYFKETNDFESPSPIPFTFNDTFDYIPAGFLSGFYFTPMLSMGINFKVEFMVNAESHVSNDPDFDKLTLKMKNEINTRLELPFSYRFSLWNSCTLLRFTPFYEYRHFGGQEGFPFDFIDTEFHLIGANLQLGLIF